MRNSNVLKVSEKRLLTAKEAESYTGLGRHGLRSWGERIGAVRKIGKRVLFDKLVIDQFLGQLEPVKK